MAPVLGRYTAGAKRKCSIVDIIAPSKIKPPRTIRPGWLGEDDLLAEWADCAALSSRQREQLEAAGVSFQASMAAGQIVARRIRPFGRLYLPDYRGEPAFILRVFDGPPPTPAYPVLHRLLDLLAFGPAEPERVWLRVGQPGLMLGRDQFVAAALEGRPLVPHLTQLDWLRADCEGFVLIDEIGRLAASEEDLAA